MMKFILLMFSFFIFNFINKFLIQLFYQNLMFLLMFLFMIFFPLNNLNFWLKIYYFLGSDFYSMGLILLSFWILVLMIMISDLNFINLNKFIYINMMNFLMIFLINCFLSMNMIMFYIFFESSLIPIFLMIMGWGFQVDRIRAGFYMMLYTLLGSFPLFIMILIIFQFNYSLMFEFIMIKFLNYYIYLMIVIAFLIKMPMYLFHLWLPKAHVEAPLIGSMILAGIMLKLGSYGLMRFLILMINMSLNYNKFLLIFSLIGGIYTSLICLIQLDMKMLVAYSSIVHMSILLSGILTMYSLGYSGTMIMMISHGLCSSGLFYLVNINYERLNSRSMLINKGMLNYFPSLSFMWFLLCSSNLSFPPSLNLFSEIMLFNSLILWDKKLMFLMILLLFFSASYTLYFYSYSQHGLIKLNYFMKNITMKEYIMLILHWFPLNFLFMYMYMYM